MRITQNEATAAERRVGLRAVDEATGFALTGLTFNAGDVKIGKNFTEANHGGTFTEIADGFYRYEFSAGEVDTLGALTLRIAKAGVLSRMYQHQVVP